MQEFIIKILIFSTFSLLSGCFSNNNEKFDVSQNNSNIYNLLDSVEVRGDIIKIDNQEYNINNIDNINFKELYNCFLFPKNKSIDSKNTFHTEDKFDFGFEFNSFHISNELSNIKGSEKGTRLDLEQPEYCKKIKYIPYSNFSESFSYENLFIILPIESNNFSLNQINQNSFFINTGKKNLKIKTSFYFLDYFNFLQPTYHLDDKKEIKIINKNLTNKIVFTDPNEFNNLSQKIKVKNLMQQYSVFSASLYVLKKKNKDVIENYINFIKFLNSNFVNDKISNNQEFFYLPEDICYLFDLCTSTRISRYYTIFLSDNNFPEINFSKIKNNKLIMRNQYNEEFLGDVENKYLYYLKKKNEFNDMIINIE